MRTAQRLAVLIATAMVPAAIVVAVRNNASAPSLGPLVTQPVFVGNVTLNTKTPAPGDTVLATVTIAADRPLRLEGITVGVRDERGRPADATGRSYDFPDVGAVELSTTQRTIAFQQQYRTRGTYVYFLEYRSGGTWHVLAPYASFTVG